MEVTLEKSEMRLVANYRREVFSGCAMCGEKTRFLPPEEIADVSRRLIYRLVESRKVYFTESPDGLLLVCFGCVKREKEVNY